MGIHLCIFHLTPPKERTQDDASGSLRAEDLRHGGDPVFGGPGGGFPWEIPKDGEFSCFFWGALIFDGSVVFFCGIYDIPGKFFFFFSGGIIFWSIFFVPW